MEERKHVEEGRAQEREVHPQDGVVDRGFDLTDESFLLYLYRHPKAFQDRLYWQHFGLVSALLPASLDHVIGVLQQERWHSNSE